MPNPLIAEPNLNQVEQSESKERNVEWQHVSGEKQAVGPPNQVLLRGRSLRGSGILVLGGGVRCAFPQPSGMHLSSLTGQGGAATGGVPLPFTASRHPQASLNSRDLSHHGLSLDSL